MNLAEIIARVRLRRKLLKMKKKVSDVQTDLVRLELHSAAMEAFALVETLEELIDALR